MRIFGRVLIASERRPGGRDDADVVRAYPGVRGDVVEVELMNDW